MAGKTGGLLKLDAICAKLKSNQDGSRLTSGNTGQDIETNNNEKAEGDVGEASPSLANGDAEKMRRDKEQEANGMNGIEGTESAKLNGTSKSHVGVAGDTSTHPSPEPAGPGIAEVGMPLPAPPTIPTSHALSSRKNKRKNFRPKNITQLQDPPEHDDLGKDDLGIEEYVINNKGVDFDAMAEDESQAHQEEPLELTNQSGGPKSEERPPPPQSPSGFVTDDCGALDLSTCCRPAGDGTCGSDGNEPQDLSTKSTGASGARVQPDKGTLPNQVASLPSCSKRDASVMKDYATNTMNELMRIYGFGDEGESITQGVPLEKFESRSILGHNVTQGVSSTALGSGLQGQSQGWATPAKGEVAREVQGTGASEVVKTGEGIYAKFTDSIANMSKLSRLPQGKKCVNGNTSSATTTHCH